ncbi:MULTISPECIES: MBG domain-containing protein [unclassified Myroides]|uniref:MBG domain-containing protein n=1 Tax=unclassified Myroides TaxID=2642485 RepID=UPI002575A972|nr:MULTISPECIES: MBG domain-containing protein [unclassified Myroides]
MKQKLLLTWLFLLSFSLSMFSQIQIGSGTSTNNFMPINTNWDYSISQQIVLKSEYANDGGATGDITKIRWFVTTNSANSNLWNQWDVYIGHTSKTSFTGSSDWIDLNTGTLVYSGTITPVDGQWMEIVLTTPFPYNGTDNFFVTVIDKKVGFTSNFPAFRSYNAPNQGLYAYQDGTVINTTNLGANSNKTRTSTVPQLQLIGALNPCQKPTNLVVSGLTSTTATVNWVNNSVSILSQEYELRTNTNVGTATGRVSFGSVSNAEEQVDLTALTPDTQYYFYIKTSCDDDFNSPWAMINFKTLCGAVDIPYVMTMASSSVVPSCVSVQDVNNDGRTWTASSKPSSSGFVDANVMKYNMHATNEANDWFFTQGLNLVAGQRYRILFKYRDAGQVEKLRVSYGSLAVNTAMTNELLTVETGTTNATVSRFIDFTPATSGVYYIGFQSYSDANKGSWFLGDVKVNLSPSCAEPAETALTSVTENSAVFRWTPSTNLPANGYAYEVRTTGNPGDTAGLVQSGTTAAGVVTATVNGLAANTAYKFYVKAVCSGTDSSAWTEVLDFRTECGIANLPYVMDINYVTAPDVPFCLTVQDLNTDDRTWRSYAKPSGSRFVGTKVMGYPFHGTNVANDWFFTQGINLVAGQSYRLKFKYADSAWVEKLRVSYGNSAVNTAMTVELFTVTTGTNSETVEKVIDFTPATSGVFYIGFQAYSDANKNILYVGDIELSTTPTCFVPETITVNALTLSHESVTFTWGIPEQAPANGYEYEVRTSGNPGEVTGRVATGTTAAGVLTATVNGLVPETEYKIYVRSVCVGSDRSLWTVGKVFKTKCLPPLMTSSTGGTICGVGQTTLQAVYNSGIIKWYETQTSTTVLGTGSTFVTPEVSQTTSFWVAATGEDLVEGASGKVRPEASAGASGFDNWGIIFNAVEEINLLSTDVFANTNGATINVKVLSPTGVELYATGVINLTNGGTTTPNVIPLNVVLPPGNGYKILIKSYSGGIIRDSGVSGFPYLDPNNILNVMSSEWGGSTTSSYYYFYNLKYEKGCTGVRKEVIATVNEAPTLNLSTNQVEICKLQTTNTITITEGVANYDTYEWLPATGVTGNTTTGWTFSPTETTEYVLTASQSNGNCKIRKTLKVIVNPIAEINDALNNVEVCPDAIGTMVAGTTEDIGLVFGTGTLSTGTTSYPNPLSGFYGGVKTQILYTKEELIAKGLTVGSKIQSLAFELGAFSARECKDFTIRMGHTTNTTMIVANLATSSTLTTVYSQSFTPSAAGYVSFTLTTPFVWDGTSNLIIETVHNAGNGGNGAGTTHRYTATTFDSVVYGAIDNTPAPGIPSIDAVTSFGTSGVSKNRPNIKFGVKNPNLFTWAPLTGLYTNPEGTTPYTGDSQGTIYVKVTNPIVYTVTAKHEFSLCTLTKEISVSVVNYGSLEVNQTIFCETVNVADIPVTIRTGATTKWYSSLASTEAITSITQTGTYYVEIIVGDCHSERQPVQIEIIRPILPVAVANQSLCEDTTLADLVVTIANRYERKWYASETATEVLPETTVLTNGTTYYVASHFPQVGCESGRVAVTVHLSRTAAPVAPAEQKFCLINQPTIASLSVEGTAVKWYNAPVGGTVYASTTPLQDGNTYYASQKLNNCESEVRTAVEVVVEDILAAPTVATTDIYYQYGDSAVALEASLTTGDELVWYIGDATTGTTTAPTPLTNAIGTTTYWVSQRIINGCESARTEVKVHVTAAVLTVVAHDKTKVYGPTDPALTYTVTGFKLADDASVLTGRLTRVVGENVGEYAINIGSLRAANYTFDFTPATFTITPAPLRVKANSLTKVYGQVDPTLSFVGEGYKFNDGNQSLLGTLVREVGENIGTYAITQGTLNSTNYTIAFTGDMFTITPAELKITYTDQTKVYGEADPALNYQVEGLANGDTNAVITGALTRQSGENVGVYTYQQGTIATTTNYELQFELGSLTITPANLMILPVSGQHKIYGQDDSVLNYTATGFKFTDTTAVISGLLGRVEGENVRLYRYTLGTLTSLHNNYVFVVDAASTFEIKPAPLNVIVDANQRKIFGAADPIFTYTLQGLQFNDRNVNAIGGNLGRVAGEAVGIYAINQGTLAARTNYYIDSFTPSTFEIVRNQVGNVTLPSKTFTYDGTVKSLAITGDLSPNATVTYVNNNQTEVGVYSVKAIIDYGPNFETKELVALLTIVKAEQVITFDELSVVILDETTSFQLEARASSRLPIRYEVTFEDEPILTLTPSGLVTPLQVGIATITAYQDGNANYLPAMPVSRKLIIKSNGTEISELIVDGVSYGKIQEETYVVLDCTTSTNKVTLDVIVPTGTTVKPGKRIVVDVPTYGLHKQEIEVISEDGTKSKIYTVIIDKRLTTENVIYQKYENVLLVNNDPTTNGGYNFVKFEWYKNDELIGTQQAYSAGNEYGMKLDPTASYYAVLTLKNGTKLTTCPIELGFESAEQLQVYPNPVRKTETLNIVLDSKTDYENSYFIYNVLGQVVGKGSFNGNRKEVNLPTTMTTGSYFLVLKSEGKHRSVQFIVRE